MTYQLDYALCIFWGTYLTGILGLGYWWAT
jgi:hypothetical protein